VRKKVVKKPAVRSFARLLATGLTCLVVIAAPSVTASAQPVEPSPSGGDSAPVEVQVPSINEAPGDIEGTPPGQNAPPVEVPPDSGATTTSGQKVVEKRSSREVTDPAEAEEIAQRLTQKHAEESGISARQSGPICFQTRFQSCKTYSTIVEQFIQPNFPNGPLEPIGNWVIDVTLQVRSPLQTQTKENVIQFYGDVSSTSPTTTIPGTYSFQLVVLDLANDSTTTYPAYVFPMVIGGTGYQQYEHYVTRNATNAFDKRTLQFIYIGDSPANDLDGTPVRTRTTGQQFRCDAAQSVNYGTGCVNPNEKPTVQYTQAAFPNISQTVKAGQAAFGFGIPGTGAPLTRGNSADNQANRDAACPRSSQQRLDLLGEKPLNMKDPSCDEYPFASTVQGGYGSTVRWVPLTENNKQGTLMVEFYRGNRVMPGDDYFVSAIG
jgi:hypothetical protein